MALAPLATASDLLVRGVTTGNIALALEVASAAVRDAAGVAITQTTSTVVVNGGPGQLLTLPGPVRSVSAVAIDTTAIPATDYIVFPNGLWRECGWATYPAPVTVTYVHGLTTAPADIVDLTCQLAISWLNHTASGGGSTAGLTYSKIDDAAEGYTEEASGQVSPVFIPEATRLWLASRFGGGGAVVVGTR